MVGAVVLMFALTAGALVWLARDVDRSISARADAQSIAFQSARAAAQSLDEAALRAGAVMIDPVTARRAATETASRLFGAYGASGVVTDFSAAGDQVTVAVRITDGARAVTGSATVRARRGVSGPERPSDR
jgi:hypothetical protein